MTDQDHVAANDDAGPQAPSVAPPTAQLAPTRPATYWVQPEAQAAGPAPGYVYVGFWRRTVAFLIDAIILTIVSYAILIPMLLGGLSDGGLSALGAGNAYTIDPVTGQLVPSAEFTAAIGQMMAGMFRGFALVMLVQGAYFVILWTWRGATLGQMALGIEIRHEADGRRIGFWRACLRYVGTLISAWVLFIGFVWVAFDARKQGWHDKIAGTYVVRRLR